MQGKTNIKFCTGVSTVTGANFLMTTPAGTKYLIDCGLVQGEKVAEKTNRDPFPYDLSSIGALFVTHAHLDHVGRIPKLVKEGFKGPIYSTPETRALAELVLQDAVGILSKEAKQDGETPIYEASDVQAVFPIWKTIQYHEEFPVSEEVSVFLKDSGHILGSSMIEFRIKNGPKILFTGDLGNSPAPLLRDTEDVGNVNYIVMESVYGDRNHEEREGRINKFKKIIDETVARGGTLVIPAFAIDRTQTLLLELNNMVEQGKIASIPIFVDSPLAIKATDIYAASTNLFNYSVQAQIARGDDIFQFAHLKYTMSAQDSREIDSVTGPKIILAGSGMSVGGRVVGHEAKYLPDPNSTILLVGYQTAGSLGRHLSEGAKKVHINGQLTRVKAHIETLLGFSAHKDSDHLVNFVSTASNYENVKNIFVVMGEPSASMHLAQRLNDELSANAIVPEPGRDYELE